MLSIIYMRKKSINACLEIVVRVRQRAIELVVQKHQIHDSIVGDQGFFEICYVIYHSCEAQSVFSGSGLAFNYL
jgi:hypothetical protein